VIGADFAKIGHQLHGNIQRVAKITLRIILRSRCQNVKKGEKKAKNSSVHPVNFYNPACCSISVPPFSRVGTKLVESKASEQKFYFMSVNNKNMATFLLGAAAAFGAYKYMKLNDEEKEKLAANLKDKANNLKDQAVAAEDKAMDYFNELKSKGTDSFKEYMPKVEEFFNNLFGGQKGEQNATATAGAAGTATPGSTTSGNGDMGPATASTI
jgi:hypothetical protein